MDVCLRRFLAGCIALLDAYDLAQPALVPFFTGKAGIQESEAEIFGQLYSNDTRTEHQHVYIIVLYALMGRIAVMAETSADAGDFVSGHASAYPASADQDATFGITAKDTQSKRLSIIRIIHRLRIVRADIHYLMAILLQMSGQHLLDLKASV